MYFLHSRKKENVILNRAGPAIQSANRFHARLVAFALNIGGDGISMFDRIRAPFTDHPKALGESYVEHMGMAFGFGRAMLLGGLACLLHGIFPFLFVKTGSDTIRELHSLMVTNRTRSAASVAVQPRPATPASANVA
jgi:hypothetical protein